MIQKPKGTKDILPQDSYKWQYIEQKTKELFENYGFKEKYIRTIYNPININEIKKMMKAYR